MVRVAYNVKIFLILYLSIMLLALAESSLNLLSIAVLECTAYLNSIQQNFQNVRCIIENLKGKSPEMTQKLNTGMKTILTQLLRQI